MGNKIIEGLSALTTTAKDITQDIMVMDFRVVKACVVSDNMNNWVLIDTGLENSYNFIIKTVENKFGKNSHPQAIVLTHGHFDHVGSVKKLLELWDVPVYAHKLELPYITGKKDYPIPDSSVDEGLVADMSPSFPHTSIDISLHAMQLPDDGRVPGLPEWKWIHTPGHTEGHISLFREKDKVLIAGDAISTTKQESLISVILQSEKISGPPKYLTTDWKAAEKSIKNLVRLKPSLVIPSHGKPLQGDELTKHLELLIHHFSDIAKPEQGQFLNK